MGAVRFRGEMRDTTGDEWRVDIYDSQYTGSPDSITLAEDGWALTWNGDIRNKVNPILTSEAVISFVMRDATDENLMTLIAGNVEGRFTIAIYQVIATVPVLFWTGTVLTDQVAYLDEYYPIRAEIRATDDIGALQDVPYDDDGTPYASNGYKTVIGHVHEALLKTRQVANFYTSTNHFLTYANDFYSVDDDVSVTDHLNSTRIYNLTWNNPNDEGVNQIVSAYEVLESICLTYNARLFQYAGSWYFLPIGAYQYDETSIDCERLKFDGTSGTSFTYSNPFQEVGSGMKKLRGWRVEYYQPYKQVNRTQVYSGNIAIIADGYYDLEVGDTLNDPDLDYASGELLKLSGDVALTYQGDGTTTGNSRVGRFLVRVTLKVGTYYLRRDVTFSGTAYDFQMEPGTVLEYTAGTMGDTTWNATAETFDTLTPTFDRNQGATAWNAVTYTMEQILPGLPTGLSGVEFSAVLYDVDNTGSLTLANSATYTGIITGLRVDWVEENQTNGDTILWKATGQDTNRGTLDQGQTYIGDLVSANSRGVLKVIGSSGPQNSSGWRSLNVTTGSLTIHRLGTQEVQALHNVTTKGYQGTLHSEILGPVHLLKDGGDYYMPTSISIQANERYTDFQGFRLTRDLTSITSDDDGRRDVNNPVGGTTGTQTGLEAVAFTTQPGGAVDSVNGQTGTVVLDAADIEYTSGTSVAKAILDAETDVTSLESSVIVGTSDTDFVSGTTGVNANKTNGSVSMKIGGSVKARMSASLFTMDVDTDAPQLEATDYTKGLVLRDSTAQRYRITINTSGQLVITAI